MRIRCWYNLNQNKYVTDYSQGVIEHIPGYINNQSHILIGNTFFQDKKVFHSLEAREKYFYKKIFGAKKRIKRFLIKLINKL